KILPFSRMLVVPIEDLDELPKVVNKILEFNPAACETFDYHTYELAKKYHPIEAKRAELANGKHMVIIALFEDDNERTNDTNATNAQAALKTIGHMASFV